MLATSSLLRCVTGVAEHTTNRTYGCTASAEGSLLDTPGWQLRHLQVADSSNLAILQYSGIEHSRNVHNVLTTKYRQ